MNVQFAVAGFYATRVAIGRNAQGLHLWKRTRVRAVRCRSCRRRPAFHSARLARALVMVGKTLDELGVKGEVVPKHYPSRKAFFRSASSLAWTSFSARK